MATSKPIPNLMRGDGKNYCKLCPKVFSYKTNLRRHIRTVHEKSIGNTSCRYCGVDYFSPMGLGSHERFCSKVVEGSAKKIECL